jgi:hypothetical protein
MISGALLSIFFVPMFYVAVKLFAARHSSAAPG